MKCFTHSGAEAVGLCAYCGRGLCRECAQVIRAPRLTCSSECAGVLARNEKVLQTILHQSVRTAQASAFYCYVCAALSGAAAVVAWFMLPSPFLILFTGGCAVVLLLSGVWYGRIARKKTSAPAAPPGVSMAG